MANELPKDVTDPERAGATSPVTGGGNETPGQETSGNFSTYMNEPSTNESPQTPKDASPVELQQSSTSASSPPSLQTIQGQINTTSSSLGDVKNQLHTKGLSAKLRQGEKQTVRDKLGDANQSIRSANNKLGNDPGAPVNLHSTKNPIARYLSLVSDGQQQLADATNMVNQLSEEKGGVSPGKMLLVQVKLAKAQQALDFTSVLLGKAVDFLKTTMQTQI